jgi:hypothetical protein
MNSRSEQSERQGRGVNWKAIRSASRKFLRTREAHLVFPNMQAFARMINAAIDLYHLVNPDEQKSFGRQMAYRLLKLALTIIGDVTLCWKKWIRR